MTLLVEDLALLALDEEGRVKAGAGLDYALAGAAVMDLERLGTVEVVDGKLAATGRSAGNRLLDDLAARIRDRRRPTGIRSWVEKLGGAGLRRQVLAQLADSGAVRHEARRALGLFPADRHVPADARAAEVRAAVRGVLLGDEPEDEGTAALAGLAVPAGVVDRLVERGRRREARKRGEALAKGDAMRGAAAKAAGDAHAAVLAAIVAASAAAAASSSSSSSSST